MDTSSLASSLLRNVDYERRSNRRTDAVAPRHHRGVGIPAPCGDYSVELVAIDWLTVDSALDSLLYSMRLEGWDVAEGEEEHQGQHPYWRSWVEFAEEIRRAGEERLPDRPSKPEERAVWPPLDLTVEMSLTDVQWQLVISALNDAATVSGRGENYDEATVMRGIAREIAAELSSQGWEPRFGDIKPLRG